MKNKVFSLFGLNKDKKEDPFLRKDKGGRELFYPWGYPGEAYCLDEKQKGYVLFFLYFVFVFFLVCTFTSIYANYQNIIGQNVLFYTNAVIFMFFPSLYFCIIYIFQKSAESYIEIKEKRSEKAVFLTWFVIVFVEIFAVFTSFKEGLMFPFFLFASYILIITFFLIKLKKNKGYIFNK